MNFNWHSAKMYLGFIIVFVIGGLQVLSKQVPDGSAINTIVSILLMLEHEFYGNTGDPTIS